MRLQSGVECRRSVRPLPVRRAWIEGEWSESWLYRAAAANGIFASQCSLGGPSAVPFRQSLDRATWVRGNVAGVGPNAAWFCGHLVPREEVCTFSSRLLVCSACLQESRSIPALWRLAGYKSCHIHQTLLESRCQHCRCAIGLGAITNGRCRCGATACDPVDEEPSVRVPVRWGANVWPAGLIDPSTMAPETLATCILKACVLIAVARSRRGRDVALAALHPAEHAELWLRREGLSQAFAVLGVKGFLDALSDPIHKLAAAFLLEKLARKEDGGPTVLSSLPLRAWSTALAPQGLIDTRKLPLACQPSHARRLGFEPFGTAWRRCGLTPAQLTRLLSPQDLLSPVAYATGRSMALVRSASVDRICQSLPPKSSPILAAGNPAVSQWIMPRTIARQLMLSGWLTKAPPESCALRFRRAQLGQLLEKVRAKALPIERCRDRTISLTNTAVYRRALAGSIGTLYGALSAGTVPLYARCEEPDFEDLELPLDQLPVLWREHTRHGALKTPSPAQLELF